MSGRRLGCSLSLAKSLHQTIVESALPRDQLRHLRVSRFYSIEGRARKTCEFLSAHTTPQRVVFALFSLEHLEVYLSALEARCQDGRGSRRPRLAPVNCPAKKQAAVTDRYEVSIESH